MRVLLAEEMRLVDQKAINGLGISSLVLMENAGVAVVRVLESEFSDLSRKRIVILAGSGNNGGDGLVVARHLLNIGARVKVFLYGNEDTLSAECETNLRIFRKLNGDIVALEEQGLAKLKINLALADIVVDALLGTGAQGPLRGLLPDVVSLVNANHSPVVAIDIPTGVDASSGLVYKQAIHATITVALGFLKTGLLLYPGREHCGKLHTVDIGIPHLLAKDIKRFLTTEEIAAALPIRPEWGHKGTFGHGLILAGSRDMAGAAYLASYALLRSGAGMATLAVPESIAGYYPPGEVMVVPLPETSKGRLGLSSLKRLVPLLDGKDVMIMGPGLGRDEEVAALVTQILFMWKKPLVLDADGLTNLADPIGLLRQIPESIRKTWVFTPHPGEMSRLIGGDIATINQTRIQTTQSTQRQFGVNMLLKGSPTIIVGAQEIYLNSTGNSGMGTAGMGDVLSGIIGGMLCQGTKAFEAAVCGVYYHGKAGDVLVKQRGARGLIASDILSVLPELL